MMVTLENDRLQVKIDSMGAELQSIRFDDTEYLWQGDPVYWTGRSPILFPIIGGLPGGTYSWKGTAYDMKAHGFAKRMNFEAVNQTADSVVFRISSNEDTLAQFPFPFQFEVLYRIENNTLWEGFRVVNKGSEELPFSVGGHPAFRCPLEDGKDFADYELVFEKPETLVRRIKRDGLLCGESQPFLNGESTKPLSHDLFYDDAVILKNLSSNWVELKSGSGRAVHVDFTGFPDLGIWSCKNDGPYVCIEPWYGVDSTKGDSIRMEEKEGIRLLNAGETFEASFSITLR